jgi:hypothetical protein
VALAADDVWAVGSASTGTPPFESTTLVEHWDGTAWHLVRSPNVAGADGSALFAIARVPGTNTLWAVGTWQGQDEQRHPLALQRFAGRWRIQPTADTGGGEDELFAISALRRGNLWAVGTAGTDALAEHFRGHGWSLTAPAGPHDEDTLVSVAPVSATDIWAAGNFFGTGTSGDPGGPLLWHWSGSAWSLLTWVFRTPAQEFTGIALTPAGSGWLVGQDQHGGPIAFRACGV